MNNDNLRISPGIENAPPENESPKGLSLWLGVYQTLGQIQGELKSKADKSDIEKLRNEVQYMKGKLDSIPGQKQFWSGIITILITIVIGVISIATFLKSFL